jgi:cytochrome P450
VSLSSDLIDLTDIDLTDVDAFVDGRHHGMLAWLRANDPVHWHTLPDGGGFWALTRYRDVAAAYANHSMFSSSGGAMLGGSFRSGADTASGRMLVAADPPRHRLLRKIMHRLFTPEMVVAVQAQVTKLVDVAVDRMVRDGGADFATDIAPELPAAALMTMVGISHADAHHLIGLTRQMIGYQDPAFVDTGGDDRLRLAGIQAEIFEFFADLVRERRLRPGDDLVGILLTEQINGRPIPAEDVLYNCMNVAVGGNETSSYTACTGLLALIEEPAQWRLLTDRPGLLGSAVNEMLRWSSTNAYVQRVALRDVELAGRQISAGDSVTLWNVSANRDEDQFADPGRFDITRTPNRHLSYGSGIHRCIGATLAHVELSTLFQRLMRERAGFTLAGEVMSLRSNFILGTTAMPLRITSGGAD